MAEKSDWSESLASQCNLIDCDIPKEDKQKNLSDIILFCKNPSLYCIQKCIPPPIISGKPLVISEEESNLVKTVFQDYKTEDFETQDPITGLTPIHYAAYFGTISALFLMSEKGANLNIPTKKGTRPLHLAVINQQVSAVKFLLERGANPGAVNNELDTPFHLACVRHNSEIVELFLATCSCSKSLYSQVELEENLNASESILKIVNSQGNIPLTIAVLNNQCETVKMIINCVTEENAGTSFQDNKGNTLLHLAAEKGNVQMIKTLINECPRNIKINAKNKEGKTAFDIAHLNNFADCCQFLLQAKHEHSQKYDKNNEEDEENSSSDESPFDSKVASQAVEIPSQKSHKNIRTQIFKEIWVHIDLKGAPPKQDFYVKLFAFLKQNFVTGILLEVEDCLDFSGIFSCIRKPNFYTDSQLEWIISEAAANHMQIIPLVQSFGHLEFILKHKEFSRLRESPDSYLDVCPSNPDTLKIIITYISQVLQKFPRAKYLHIGADEVCNIGVCPECKLNLIETSRESLYYQFMDKVIKEIKKIRPIEILIWDDMIRYFSQFTNKT